MYPLDPHGVKKWGDMTPPQLLWMRRPSKRLTHHKRSSHEFVKAVRCRW